MQIEKHLLSLLCEFDLVLEKKVIPYVTVTIFAVVFSLVLPVNYLLLAGGKLLFACLYRNDLRYVTKKANFSMEAFIPRLFAKYDSFKLLVNSLKVL